MTDSQHFDDNKPFDQSSSESFVAGNDNDAANPLSSLEGGLFEDQKELIEALRNRATVLMSESKLKIILRHGSGNFSIVSRQEAETFLAPYQYVVETDKKFRIVAGFPIYLSVPERDVCYGLTCAPNGPSRVGDKFNTWRGFAKKPKKGSWKLMRQHLLEVVCSGNEEHFVWLLCWIAQLFQKPQTKMGTAPVLIGLKGAGKSILEVWIRTVVGNHHGAKVSHLRHLTGHFNLHLRDCVFLAVEDAVWGGYKEAEGVLRDLITAQRVRIEGKGVDSVEFDSNTHVMITGNPGWVVPATGDERRYFVLYVKDLFEGMTEKEKDEVSVSYFTPLEEEFANGGPEAMLYDLLQWDWSQVNLRKAPMTVGLRDQINQSLNAEDEWLATCLTFGGFVDRDGVPVGLDAMWPTDNSDFAVDNGTILRSYSQHVRSYSGSANSIAKPLRKLQELCPVAGHRLTKGDLRPYGQKLAPLQVWRDAWAQKHKVALGTEGVE